MAKNGAKYLKKSRKKKSWTQLKSIITLFNAEMIQNNKKIKF